MGNVPDLLFVFEGVRRVGPGGLEGLEADRGHGHEESTRPGQDKQPGSNARFVGVALEPFPHDEIADGPGYEVGRDHPLGEFPGEQNNDPRHRCAQDLADADLLGPLFGGERGQPEKPQAGDENGQRRKVLQECPILSSDWYIRPKSWSKKT